MDLNDLAGQARPVAAQPHQTQVAGPVGVGRMHISRLPARSLATQRGHLTVDD
jgi:hypothetical protein